MRHITLIIAVLALAVAAPAIAGKGGNGNGNGGGAHGGGGGSDSGGGGSVTGACTVSGNVVYATGLPADEVINFMVTDSSGTWGFVLGYTHDGNWTVSAPTSNGPTMYAFVSRTYGSDGSKYTVFQSCSA